MIKRQIKIILALFILATSLQINAKGWSDYKYFDSFKGVNYYYKVKYTKSGKTKIKWKVKNTNSYKVLAGFKTKKYTLAGGKVIKKGGEAWYVKPYSEYSFISDPMLDGRLVQINIVMQVKKE
jgi:hypothetical protein